jgi:DivIVA domain-containing protein
MLLVATDAGSPRIAHRNGHSLMGGQMLDAPGRAAMIDRITNAKFDTTGLKPGYDEKEVDDFLDQVVAQLRAGGLPEARGARFSPTRRRPGYAQQDVDDLLREIDLYAEPRRSALGPQGAASPGSDRRASARLR